MSSSTNWSAEPQNENTRQFTAVDLFSGAGGFSLAASACGFQIIGAIEFDQAACETYKKNIASKNLNATKVLNKNIMDVEPKKFREDLGIDQYELDLLLGGPPCQGFSSHRIKGKGIEDPRNDLLIRYFDFVKELGPKVFLVENVPGLLWKRHEKYLRKFQNLARRHGYVLFQPVKLNAKDYGVPQSRERIFLLGVNTRLKKSRKLIAWPPPATHSAPGHGQQEWLTASTVFPEPPENVLNSLNEKLGKNIVEKLRFNAYGTQESDSSNLVMNHSEELTLRFASTPVDGSRHDVSFRLPCHDKEYNGHKDVYGRVRLGQPGPTITTGCINPSKGRFVHPWLNHGISPRYAARMQTFPDDFEFHGGITTQGKQIGNAVPIKLATALISTVYKFLNKQ